MSSHTKNRSVTVVVLHVIRHLQYSQQRILRDSASTYVVEQLSSTNAVGVAEGQHVAGHGSTDMDSTTQSGVTQRSGGEGEIRNFVEVIVEQYASADVVTVIGTALIPVMVLRLMVVYVVVVNVQAANAFESRETRLKASRISSYGFRVFRALTNPLAWFSSSIIEKSNIPNATEVLNHKYMLMRRA